ncbi:MAG: hypothetical protein HFI86_04685 [Bacilli bacterium]|nr:hypothetical protein [Bacilli bacterium]
MSKYKKLWEYLKDNKSERYELSFNDIKAILGFELDHSFLNYKKEATEYGYEVNKISLKTKTIIFSKLDK